MSAVRAPAARPAPHASAIGLRLLLGWVAATNTFTGAWATFATDAFHRSFPLGAPGWVAPLGPASPHFTADVGAFYLAFALLFAWAAWRVSRELVVPLVSAWTVFSVLHLGWHAFNTEPFGTGDAVAQLFALALVLALPLLALRLLPAVNGDGSGRGSSRR